MLRDMVALLLPRLHRCAAAVVALHFNDDDASTEMLLPWQKDCTPCPILTKVSKVAALLPAPFDPMHPLALPHAQGGADCKRRRDAAAAAWTERDL